MITKTTEPLFGVDPEEKLIVVGTKVEYRVFGILLYKKILKMPEDGFVFEYGQYYIRI